MRLRLLPFLALSLALTGTACSSLSVAAASVNGEKISEAAVEAEFDRVRSDPTFQDLLARQADQARGFARRQLLTAMIQQTVMAQAARELGVEVTRDQVDRLIDDQAARFGVSTPELLDSQNLTQEEAEELAERAIRQLELRERVTADVEMSDEEVAQIYEQNMPAFEEVRLSRITVDSQEEAEEVIADLESGRDFAAVAREVSTDGLASEGGDMGFVPTPELGAAVTSAIEETSDRGITDPVPAAAGFEIYRVIDRRRSPLEDVEEQIRSRLLDDARQRAFQGWLADQLREADIVVNPKYGRFDTSNLEVTANEGQF